MDEYRTKGGAKAAIVGISSNIFLTIFNIIIGVTSGSYALISEGAHTLSDVATSIIAYLGFRIGQKPADEDHPLGHGRAEAIAGLVIVLFLTMVAYEIMSGAIYKILNPKLITTPSYFAAIMALIGIGVNICISRYIINLGKKIRSPAIVADGNHQKVDIFSSVAILVGVLASNSGYPLIDPIIGLIIGLFVLKTAYTIGKENIDNIMGKLPSKQLIKDIENAAVKTPQVQGAHNIKVEYLGSYSIVSLHIELNENMTLKESHKIVHKAQRNVLKKVPLVKSVTIHACPAGIEYNHNQEIDE
ncbi:cation diffusion facilitator family transporter [uncultured Methanobrevibacter sp.]|uniref:cation diffusion facilitator family transporter n=1 Tax=uncultured Methanobrevibacter sp. TaxID=253161 RepID=UPI0026266962|nr:cation diffusion facilitator family transporter [uncultured Methanobrevibacter sp.]